MPRETLEPLPPETYALSSDRCYCLPEGELCAPCQAANDEEAELLDELEPMELEDRLQVALDNGFAADLVRAAANRLDDTFEVQVAIRTREVKLRIEDTK